MHRCLRDLAHDLADVLGPEAARGQPSRAVDVGLRHRPAGIGLKRQRVRHPARAEIACQRVIVALSRMREPMKQPMNSLEYRARTDKSRPRQ